MEPKVNLRTGIKEIKEAADTLVSFEWNSTNREHTVAKILKLMGKNAQAYKLREYLVNEQKRLNKNNQHDFDLYYGKGIIETLDKLYELVRHYRGLKSALSVDSLVTIYIDSALKESFLYRGFNWKNCETLIKADMLDVVNEFNNSFRGDIKTVHKVKDGQYVIVETEKNKIAQFYAFVKQKDDTYKHSNCLWYKFEDALFEAVCPKHHTAMSVLYESSLKS